MSPEMFVLTTFYFIIVLLALWWGVKSIQHHLDRALSLNHQQRNADLQHLREWLVVEIRSLRRS